MKMKIKYWISRIIVSLFFVSMYSITYAQHHSYSYDDSGNRKKREYSVFVNPDYNREKAIDTVAQSTYEIKAYPNPFSEQVTISIESKEELEEGVQVFLFNELGQLVQEFNMKQKLKTIQTQNLAKGKYFIRLIRKEESEEFILIKN